MGDIVNLRRARKAKKRSDDARTGQANRIAFGRTRVERELTEKEKQLATRKLDGHLLRPDDDAS